MKIKMSEIKRLVSESLDELTRGGKQVTPAQPTINQAAGGKPAAGKPQKPICSTAFYSKPDANGEECLTIRLNNIHEAHKTELFKEWQQQFGDIFKINNNRQQQWGKTACVPIDLEIFPGKEDDFVKAIPALVQTIASKNGTPKNKPFTYDPKFLNGLEMSILGRMDEAPSEDDFNKANERQTQNLKAILTKLSDPAFVKSLGFVGGVSPQVRSNLNDIVKQGNATGWRLSPGNQLMVKTYLPNATFVTNAWTWDNVFNRNVIDPTQFAFELKAANNKPNNPNANIQAAAQLGYFDKNNPNANPWDVYKAIRGKLSQSERMAVEFLANINNPHKADIIPQKVYDISNTQLKTAGSGQDMEGKPDSNGYMYDRFNEEVNFLDNIQGVPNAIAQAQINAQNKGNQTSTTASPAPIVWQPKSNEEIGDLINILKAICMKKCGTMPKDQAGNSLGDTIAHYAAFYATRWICPRRNIVKDNLKTAIGNTFAAMLAAVYAFTVQTKGSDISRIVNDSQFNSFANSIFNDFLDLVKEINVELLKLSASRMKQKKVQQKQPATVAATTSAPATAPAQGTGKQAMEESVMCEDEPDNISSNIDGLKQAFMQVLKSGGDSDALNGGNDEAVTNEENFEEVNDIETPEQIQEAFFKMLDKLENING